MYDIVTRTSTMNRIKLTMSQSYFSDMDSKMHMAKFIEKKIIESVDELIASMFNFFQVPDSKSKDIIVTLQQNFSVLGKEVFGLLSC